MISLRPELQPAECGTRSFKPNHSIRQVRGARGWNSPHPPYQSLPIDGITNAARSRQPGGVNVGLADGSVRYVKDTINLFAWRALSTTHGNEVISSDSY